MRIHTRIVLGLALLGLLSVASSVSAYVAVDQLTSIMERVAAIEIPAVERLDRLLREVVGLERHEARLLAEGGSPASRAAFTSWIRALDARRASLSSLDHEPVLPDFQRTLHRLLEDERRIAALAHRGAMQEAQQVADALRPVRTQLQDLGASLLSARLVLVERIESANLLALQAMRQTALVCATVSVIVTVFLAFAGVRTVLAPLRGLVDVVRRVRAGDLSARWHNGGSSEFDELGRAIGQMVSSLQSRIDEVASKNDALQRKERETQRELLLAQTVQRSIVPRDANAPGLTIFTHFLAAHMIGGDFYDIVPLDDPPGRPPRVALTVGDASGHGIPAALVMVLALTLMREALRRRPEPGEVLARVNRELLEHLSTRTMETFVTASCVVVDPAGGTLRMSGAGNEPPLLWRRDRDEIASLEATGLFLGSFPDSRYPTVETSVAAGDRLLIFSDGLTESRSPQGEFFGRERIEALVRDCAHVPVAELGRRIVDALRAFSQQRSPRDDVALLIAEIGEREA